jgi:SprB repeat
VTIGQPTALSINLISSPVLCFGGSTGTVNITASGGTQPYQYQWNTGATTASVGSLSIGNYTVIVSDANGCSANASTSISQPTALTANGVVVPVACFGQTGSVNLSVGGGTPNYSYFWENGATTQDVSGLSSGSYSVTVVDGNGCRVDQSFNLSQPGGLSVATSSKAVLCFGGTTGTASVTASGGTQPYQYRWETGAITPTITNLSAGSYSVVVTDKNGCTFTDYVSVNEPSSLTYTLGQVNASCNGSATGSLSITGLGGTGPYSYSWNTGATTQTIRNLRADEYVVTITDGNGCVLDVGATVEQPRPLSTTVLSTSANCPGGTGIITVEVVGGVPDYAYRWSNGATSSTVFGLSATTAPYTLTVTDANGCTATTQAVVSQPPAFALNAVAKPVLCKGAASGEVNLTVEGGTAPYLYQWSIGQTSQDIVGLLAGTYSVTVTDKNGCREITSVNLGEPTALTLSESHKNLVCFGQPTGSVSLSVEGGTAPYSFSWTDGQGQSVGTTADLDGLESGSYRVLVIDGAGCLASLSVVIGQPTALSVIGQTTPALYASSPTGTASITASGGTQPYQYQWNTGETIASISSLSAGSYSVVVTDKNGCSLAQTFVVASTTAVSLSLTLDQTNLRCVGSTNGAASVTASGGNAPYSYLWSNGATTSSISSLSAGGYTVLVTDAAGQTATASALLTPPLPFTVSVLPTDLVCLGKTGQVSVEVRGSSPTLSADYTYLWSNGSTGATVYGLSPGNYSLVVTNANGCTASTTATLVQSLTFALNGEVLAVPCKGGASNAIDLTVEGGTSPYRYQWSNGATTEDLEGILSGMYSVTVTDKNNCRETTTFSLSQPGSISLVVSSIAARCFGTATGSASVTASGGSPGYTYSWRSAAGYPSSASSQLLDAPAGSYSVVVTDFYGCTAIQSLTIGQPTALSIVGQTTPALYASSPTGTASITASGGTQPYQYQWNTGATTASISSLSAGSYSVVVTDKNGCSLAQTFVVASTTAVSLSLTLDQTNLRCVGSTNGAASVTASGGNAPYRYLWSNGATTASISSLSAGGYTVLVTDAAGQTATASALLSPPLPFTVSVLPTDLVCLGKTGQVSVEVRGSAPTLSADYTYLWSNGSTGATVYGLSPGNYSLVVTNANGCTASTTATLVQSLTFALNGEVLAVPCKGGASNAIDLTVEGGTSPYRYQWSNGATTEDLEGILSGMYSVTVTDKNNCRETTTFSLSQPGSISLVVSSIAARCFGTATGSASVTASGGSPGYTYSWRSAAGYPSSASPQLLDAPAGSYSVVVTDFYGCTAIQSLTIGQPTALTVSLVAIPVSCSGNVANTDGKLVLSGFQTGDKYSLIVGPDNGQTIPSGNFLDIPTDGVLRNNLANPAIAQLYSVRVVNGADCKANASATLKNLDCGCAVTICVPFKVKKTK